MHVVSNSGLISPRRVDRVVSETHRRSSLLSTLATVAQSYFVTNAGDQTALLGRMESSRTKISGLGLGVENSLQSVHRL